MQNTFNKLRAKLSDKEIKELFPVLAEDIVILITDEVSNADLTTKVLKNKFIEKFKAK